VDDATRTKNEADEADAMDAEPTIVTPVPPTRVIAAADAERLITVSSYPFPVIPEVRAIIFAAVSVVRLRVVVGVDVIILLVIIFAAVATIEAPSAILSTVVAKAIVPEIIASVARI
jgi:hypothetical protein